MDKEAIKNEKRAVGVMIAAPSSGSGKTTVTTGLIAALKGMNLKVSCFKCGPDFIDPMYHTRVLGVPGRNLDTWFTGEKKTRELFLDDRNNEGTISIVEGVMGLYDGVAGTEMEGSSYDLARVINIPVILVVSARGMGRSVSALIRGFCDMDTHNLIRGIILNNITEAMYLRLKPVIENDTGRLCMGFIPKNDELRLPERYLGLVTPDGVTMREYEAFAGAARKQAEKTLDLELILETAGADIKKLKQEAEGPEDKSITDMTEDEGQGPLLAVARDEAFCFMYEDNLRELKRAGARISFFSPLRDRRLPEGISGLLLSGGYPELYAEQLSGNRELLDDIRCRISEGLPVVAECGGFMYLQESISTGEGRTFAMAGVLKGRSENKGHSVRFGYVEVTEKNPRFLPEGMSLKGHEFHYYDSDGNGDSCRMVKPVTGRSWDGIVTTETLWAGFPHIYYPAEPGFADEFVKKMKVYSAKS